MISTATANYQAFSISLKVHLVKNTTINSSTAPQSNTKLVTYMNNDNGFDVLVEVFFAMSPQLGGIVTKAQDLVTSFEPIVGYSLPDFNLQALQARR